MLRAGLIIVVLAVQAPLLLTLRDTVLGISEPNLIAAGAGIVAYIVFALFSRNIEQWHFHVHELTHMVAALCCFARIDEFHVSREKGGYVSYSGVKSNAFITLSPYWLPILCFVPLGLRYIVQDSYVVWFVGLTAFAWALHFDVAIRQTRTYQSDIKEQGPVFSFISIACLNVLAFAVVLALALGEPVAAAAQFAEHTRMLAGTAANWTAATVPQLLQRAGMPI